MSTPHNIETKGSYVIVPVAGVHALKVQMNFSNFKCLLLTNGETNANYVFETNDVKAEVKRLQEALRGGHKTFLLALTERNVICRCRV